MKIFSAAQIRECDAQTITASRITSIELMERAATRCVKWISENLPKDALFVVLCGTGNNGGDGLAITRMLRRRGHGVKAFMLQTGPDRSADCTANLERLQSIGSDLITVLAPDTFITDIPQNIIIIDAILGTGVNRSLSGWLDAFVTHVNNLPNRKLAIDMPTGLSADSAPGITDTVLAVNDTLSFQFYKRSFLHPEAAPFTGNVHIIDIGLDAAFIEATHTHYATLEAADAAALYRPRSAFAHKGNCGSALLIGGQYGKIGAITLASKAAMRAGAGLVTALVPGCGYNILQTALPEAMCLTNGEKHIEKISQWEHAGTIGIGPGLGTAPQTAAAVATFLDDCSKPIVIDADALNIIAAHPELLARIPKDSILTPHPKEFGRIFGENTNNMVQVDNARIQAMRYNINIVLKGHHTAIINTDGECRYNMNGNAGMATGGSGDVLTGIITGLLAQGYTPYNAATLGVYLHGLAGDLAAAELSQEAMIAGDIIAHLAKAFKSLRND
jgi:ADP-dependent NAD(P)H-hydrate dehydratase / NAD(P)H-hydrate epimerase